MFIFIIVLDVLVRVIFITYTFLHGDVQKNSGLLWAPLIDIHFLYRAFQLRKTNNDILQEAAFAVRNAEAPENITDVFFVEFPTQNGKNSE